VVAPCWAAFERHRQRLLACFHCCGALLQLMGCQLLLLLQQQQPEVR
jgi:hypothetical protein